MTDIQQDIPVGTDDEAAETVSTHTEASENAPVAAASECPAAVSDVPAPNDCGDGSLTNDVEAEPALNTPSSVEPVIPAADFAATDPASDGGTDAVGATAGSIQGDQAGMAPASPPLREPDEAALRLAEAAVLASATPMTPRALSQILADDLDPAAVIAALRARYDGRGFELCEIGGGLQFRTAADLAPQLRKVVQVPRRLPRVALETLAIVAYHQPITRPEIEDLRGTGLSQQTLDVLLENDLIVARGRKETPGRPTLWGTTAKFLEYFGLRDIRELPRRQDLLLEAVQPETADTDPLRPDTAAETEPVPPDGAQPGSEATQPA
ncbi:MAG TPA: SMC-Scp complex subunit ScpB [Acetobacteraceae bacterium]|jgi:segregation and condensation protein B|nr:SMC-Scp complex subunit ScpB [Acetobacteraceae bacterium]